MKSVLCDPRPVMVTQSFVEARHLSSEGGLQFIFVQSPLCLSPEFVPLLTTSWFAPLSTRTACWNALPCGQ